jgi:hypothetical protein
MSQWNPSVQLIKMLKIIKCITQVWGYFKTYCYVKYKIKGAISWAQDILGDIYTYLSFHKYIYVHIFHFRNIHFLILKILDFKPFGKNVNGMYINCFHKEKHIVP